MVYQSRRMPKEKIINEWSILNGLPNIVYISPSQLGGLKRMI